MQEENKTSKNLDKETIENKTEETTEEIEEITPTNQSDSISENVIKTKYKKVPLFIGIAVWIIAIIVIIVVLSGGNFSLNANNRMFEPRIIQAEIDDKGTAYLPLMDGDSLEINDEVRSAFLTADGETVVVLLEKGTLYFTDKILSEKTQIS